MLPFFFLGVFLGVDVLGHKAMLCLTFENTATLFSQVMSPFCTLCGRRLSTEEKGGGAYKIQSLWWGDRNVPLRPWTVLAARKWAGIFLSSLMLTGCGNRATVFPLQGSWVWGGRLREGLTRSTLEDEANPGTRAVPPLRSRRWEVCRASLCSSMIGFYWAVHLEQKKSLPSVLHLTVGVGRQWPH